MQIKENVKEEHYQKINKNKEKFTLHKGTRVSVYILLLLSCLFTNIIGSLIPSSSKIIKNDLQIDEIHFGLLNLFLALGKIFGSIFFMKFNKKINRKLLILLVISLYSIISFIFRITYNFPINSLSLLFMGFFNMIINIFIPIWVQQFGIGKYKLFLISMAQIINPIGKILGFLFNFYINWINVLTLIGVTLAIIFFVSLIISNKYYSSEILILVDNETGEEMIDKRAESNAVFYTVKEEKEGEDSSKSLPLIDMSTNNVGIEIDPSQYNDKMSLIMKLKLLFNNKIFLISLIIKAIIIGIQSTIFFWFTDVIKTTLDIKEMSQNLFANIMLIIAPPLGNFLTKFLGSFDILGKRNKKKTLFYLIFFYLISCIIAYFLIKQFPFGFIAFTLTYGFLSSACLPILQGICLSCVHKKVVKDATTYSHLFCLFFGTGLSPYIFGILYQINLDKRIAINIFLSVSLGLGIFSLPLLIYYILKKNYLENQRKNPYEKRYPKNQSFISIDKNGKEDLVEQFANSYGEELPDIVKAPKKTSVRPIKI